VPYSASDLAARDAQALNTIAEGLRRTIKACDERLGEQRATLDSRARLRDYRGLEQTGAQLVVTAKAAEQARADLDLVQTELGKRKK
jgi:hypothetical protein